MTTTLRPDQGLRSVHEIMEGMMTKLEYCQNVKIAGEVQQCPYLAKGGICGFQRLREGPHKGQFPTLSEVDVCPARWTEKAQAG